MSENLVAFEHQLGTTSLSMPELLTQEAKEGIARQASFPTTRDEPWKYTRLARVAGLSVTPIAFNGAPTPLNGMETIDVIFEKGTWSCSTDVEGLTLQSANSISPEAWQACTTKGHVQHLNTLTAQGGIGITVASGMSIQQPIRIIHRCSGERFALVLHHQIKVEDRAQVRIELIFEGEADQAYSNVLTDFFVGKEAQVHVDKWQNTQGNHYGFYNERIYQDRHSTFRMQTLTTNTHFTRNDVEVFSQGEAAHTQLYGAFFGRGQQLIDNHTYVHHMAPHGTSDENYKGVLWDKATGVFNGKVKVYQDAQKINAYQSNKNLLLSSAASMNAKPELEIYADDVKCSHGSTTGQLDAQALFYLQARGISKAKATEMLVGAFCAEVFEAVQSEYIQTAIAEHLTL
ncbi:MAG: Fe-S cluster assembly protein SufD [Flavobacteriia bacterium]|jgi:Fe-S cluster assembly protein SufD|nr:Fe-S cluster assembly protein SufD [Flavobacteriia bacterium]